MSSILQEALRAITSALQNPVIGVLLLLIAAVIVMTGMILVELFTDRRRLKEKIPLLIDRMQGLNEQQLAETIKKSGLLKRQKAALQELIKRSSLPENSREALARQLLFQEQEHYDRITKITDIISRISPMFGLMGTLIPLGPGLIALGQGDTKTLSESLLIAFDTTVAGLISGAVAFIISAIRKRWYEGYMVGLETIMECVLEEQSKVRKGKNENRPEKKQAAGIPSDGRH